MDGARNFPQVAVRMPPALKLWLQAEAKAEHRTLNGQIVQALQNLYASRTRANKGGK